MPAYLKVWKSFHFFILKVMNPKIMKYAENWNIDKFETIKLDDLKF